MICDHRDECTTLGPSRLEKGQTPWAGGEGWGEDAGQPADSPSAEQRALREKKAWPF